MPDNEFIKLKQELQDAEDRFKALFEHGPIGATFNQILYDDNGDAYDYRFIHTNKNFKEFTGVDPVGQTAREAFPGIENDPFDWIGKFANVVKTGQAIRVEQHFPLNNRWYDLVSYKYKDDLFVVAFLDISEHKKAQIELAEVNAGMRSVFDATSRISIIKTDTQGTITFFNKGAEKLLGYKAEELIGKITPEAIHLQSEVVERSIELTKELGKPIKGFDVFVALPRKGNYEEREWTYVCKNGDHKIVLLSVTPVKSSDDDIVGFLGTAVDITDRKMMEQKLRESESLFRSLFEESDDAFLLIEGNNFVDCNHAAVKMFGARNIEDILQHHPSSLSPQFQPDGQTSMKKAEEMMSIAFHKGTNRFEWDHRKIDGTVFPAEILLTKIIVGNKNLLHTCIRDITDRKEADEKLRQSQKMEVVGQLAGGVAHDFNNMLSGIIGATEILQMEVEGNEDYTKYTEIILQAAERAADLTQQLLAFGRKGNQETQNINLHDLVNTVGEMLNHTINKNIHIHIDLKAKNPYITGDSSLIQNAILNLCINARDAMPEGGQLSIITSTIKYDGDVKDREGNLIPSGDYTEMTIKDNGTGIEKKQLNKIFEPFFTTKEVGQGTGLGLASVYGTIKSHKSYINIESEVGKGTTFILDFPESLSKENVPVEHKGSDIKISEGTVLIIDDEQVLRDTMRIMLEGSGLKVFTAENGVEGIKKYSRYCKEIDLIILDIIMPQLSGKECLVELQKINPDIKTVFVSGYTRNEDIQDILIPEKNIFLTKPFRKKDLVEAVKKLL